MGKGKADYTKGRSRVICFLIQTRNSLFIAFVSSIKFIGVFHSPGETYNVEHWVRELGLFCSGRSKFWSES